MKTPDDGLILKPAVNGAEFWISEQSSDALLTETEDPGGDSVRMILVVNDLDTLFEQVLERGAKEIFPIGKEHGWRSGRLVDPFGLTSEIGKPVN